MPKFIEQNTNTEVVLLPPKSPNLNAYMERWFRSLKSECLDRMIFFGQRSLERAVTTFVPHYHAERNYQGLSNHLIDPEKVVGAVAGRIECRERLGGMLKYDTGELPDLILNCTNCGHSAVVQRNWTFVMA